MTDNSNFSSDLQNDPGLDQALADIERAMVRFEQILSRHGQALGKAGAVSRRRNTTNRIITNSLSGIFELFSGKNMPSGGTATHPNTQKNNRFPSSGGQFLADLAASIQQIGGRNL